METLQRIARWLDTTLLFVQGRPVQIDDVLWFLLTLIGAFLAGRLVRRIIARAIRFRRDDDAAAEGLAYAFGRIAQYVTVVTVALMGLENIGISVTTIAALGAVLSVGLGFGLQTFVSNVVSGFVLLIERPVAKGDFIRVGDHCGEVHEIAIRATTLITRDGCAVVVPNSQLVSGVVTDFTAPTQPYRAHIRVGCAYGTDTSSIRESLLAVAKAAEPVLDNPAPSVLFVEFGESALLFDLCVWLTSPANEPQITSDLRFAIDQALRDAGITIPFPQRDIHVRSMPRATP